MQEKKPCSQHKRQVPHRRRLRLPAVLRLAPCALRLIALMCDEMDGLNGTDGMDEADGPNGIDGMDVIDHHAFKVHGPGVELAT